VVNNNCTTSLYWKDWQIVLLIWRWHMKTALYSYFYV